jgi:hypothetical protein
MFTTGFSMNAEPLAEEKEGEAFIMDEKYCQGTRCCSNRSVIVKRMVISTIGYISFFLMGNTRPMIKNTLSPWQRR